MPKRRTPILEKVKRLMRVSISLAKMSKSAKRGAMKLKLLRHYESYGFIQEYQFSPSKSNNTPLIHIKQSKNRGFYSVLEVVFVCLRGGFGIGRQEIRRNEVYFHYCYSNSAAMEGLPAIEYSVEEEAEEREDEDEDEDEDGYSMSLSSVDERAERFIDKFYQQMRLQRIESSLLLCD